MTTWAGESSGPSPLPLAGPIGLPRVASALASGALFKGMSCSTEGLPGSLWAFLRDAAWVVDGEYASRLLSVHFYISISVAMGSWSALPMEGTGGRLEGIRKEAFLCFLWHRLHSFRTHVTGPPGSVPRL